MKLKNLAGLISIAVLLLSVGFSAAQKTADAGMETEKGKVAIARIWHGKTKTDKADEYYAYLKEGGIQKIQSIAGNVGVQVLRRTTKGVTEFTVISYWESLDAIRAFAGPEIERTHNLPRDREFLLEMEPTVAHHEVVLNDWKR